MQRLSSELAAYLVGIAAITVGFHFLFSGQWSDEIVRSLILFAIFGGVAVLRHRGSPGE